MSIHTLGFGLWDLGFNHVPALLAMASPAQSGANAWVQFIPILIVIAIFYFVVVMPMKKRQQKVQAFLKELKAGDKVITSGGIYGSLVKVNEQSVQLQVANNVRIEVSKAAIIGYQGQEPVVPEGSQS
jgi:preprotein translocase subunit YajC